MGEFPWSHLFSEVGVEETEELHNEIESKHRSDEISEELIETTNRLMQLREISEKTFRETQELADTKNNNELLELEYTVMTQMVMASRENLKDEKWTKRVLKGVLLWLQQRKNLIIYLRKHQSHEELCVKFEKLLFPSKQDILDIVERLQSTGPV